MSLDYIVFALPRTRSFWLSKFLSYEGLKCEHDDWIGLNHRPWFNGSVETGMIPYWKDIKTIYPKMRMATVRRPIDEVISSLMRLELPIHADKMIFTVKLCIHHMYELENADPSVLKTSYEELATEEGCAKIFQHCLQRPFDHKWWMYMKDQNLQVPREKILEAFDA